MQKLDEKKIAPKIEITTYVSLYILDCKSQQLRHFSFPV